MSGGASRTEVVADVRCHVGEGPAWDDRDGSLLWIDIVPGWIFRYVPETGELDRACVWQETSVCIPRASGGYVIGGPDGFYAIDRIEQGVDVELLVGIEVDQPGNLMNDAKCDAAGRLWGGTRSRTWIPEAGSLYRVDPDLTVTRVLDGISTSNGLGWSPDNERMYYIDSQPGILDVLDYDLSTGEATNRRRFADFPKEGGDPDGLTIDAEGCVWVAVVGGQAIHRFGPDGTLEEVFETPTRLPTSCCWGGADLTDLYWTSGCVEMSATDLLQDPHAGGVFVSRPGVQGTPTIAFAG